MAGDLERIRGKNVVAAIDFHETIRSQAPGDHSLESSTCTGGDSLDLVTVGGVCGTALTISTG